MLFLIGKIQSRYKWFDARVLLWNSGIIKLVSISPCCIENFFSNAEKQVHVTLLPIGNQLHKNGTGKSCRSKTNG